MIVHEQLSGIRMSYPKKNICAWSILTPLWLVGPKSKTESKRRISGDSVAALSDSTPITVTQLLSNGATQPRS